MTAPALTHWVTMAMSVSEIWGLLGGMGPGSSVRALVAEQLDEKRIGGVAGNDDGAVVSALEQACAGVDVEAAAMVGAAVAASAVGVEDGLDFGGVKLWLGGILMGTHDGCVH